MKVDSDTFTTTTTNDATAIGITVKVQMGTQSTEQHFIADDASEEVGRVIGTLISQLTVLKNVDETPVLSEATVNEMSKSWRGVIRG